MFVHPRFRVTSTYIGYQRTCSRADVAMGRFASWVRLPGSDLDEYVMQHFCAARARRTLHTSGSALPKPHLQRDLAAVRCTVVSAGGG